MKKLLTPILLVLLMTGCSSMGVKPIEIFKTEVLSENLNNLNGKYTDNHLVTEVLDFINKDKKRPICTPFSK